MDDRYRFAQSRMSQMRKEREQREYRGVRTTRARYAGGNRRSRTAPNKIDLATLCLVGQMIVAIIVLSACYTLRLSGGSFYTKAKDWYWTTLAQPAKPFDMAAFFATDHLAQMRKSIEEYAAKWSGRENSASSAQSQPGNTSQPSSSGWPASSPEEASSQAAAGESSSSNADGAASFEEATLREESSQSTQTPDGQGGLWKTVENDALEVPEGATLAPITASAQPLYPAYGNLTSFFGFRDHPILDKKDFHNGIDIAGFAGDNIYAAYPGRVTEVGYNDIDGNYIVLSHSGNIKTVYCHCQEVLAKEGTVLRAGDRIATIGATGLATGPHLHFEVLADNIYANPLWLFEDR